LRCQMTPLSFSFAAHSRRSSPDSLDTICAHRHNSVRMFSRRTAPLAVAAALLILCSCSQPVGDQPQTVDLGHRISLGHLTYTGFEVQWLPQLGTGSNARIPQSRFLLIRMSVVNGGSETLLIPNLSIEDDKGNSHDELMNGEGVQNWVGFVRRAKPAESIDGNIVFDVPPQHYRLKITDENSEHAGFIDLPLSFGSDIQGLTPTPVPIVSPKK
jgi:hypothetical protein